TSLPQKDEHDRITAAGDMVVYCAGFPAIYGRQPLYFEEGPLRPARRSRRQNTHPLTAVFVMLFAAVLGDLKICPETS
ncbi:MAG: hypothetical protein WA869_09375, partial [Alloacidobacterium sp.]